MMDYKKICENCLKQENIVVGLWEGILEPISCKYAFTLLEMWWVVNEYDHWIKLHGSRENVEKDIKEWYEYHKNGGTINLWHWLMGARE